jgi:putative tricarboxylic transport membrane protein
MTKETTMQTRVTKFAALLALSLGVAAPALAAGVKDYPARNVEAINQFGPGGGTDLFIRAIGQPFADITGKSLVGLSVTGGGGIPAATQFFSRRADGHTLMAIGPEEVINHAKGRIDATKFMPVARVQYDQGLFYVSADSPIKNLKDLVEHARKNPGKLSISMTGAAGFDETLVGLWNARSGAELNAVPFDSGAESVSAVLGGHTDLMYEEYGPSRALIEAGRLRPLVVFSEERLPVLPDVPTAREAGIDVTLGRWRGFALKEGDDKAHAGALFSIFQKASQDPRYKATEEKSGLQYRSVLLGPDEFKAFLDSEIETYRAVLKSLGHI